MANNELKIKISSTADMSAIQATIKGLEGVEKVSIPASAGVKKFGNEVDSAGRASHGFSSSINDLESSVKKLAASYLGLSAISSVIRGGFELNSQFEQMKLGIASLIAVNSSNVTEMGRSITAAEKFKMAQTQAAESVDLLRKANIQTPATLAQITEGYQAALGPSLRLGLSTKQTVEYVKLMTMAAAAMGQPMEQIAQESRALLSGEIDMNAQVARNLQITNEQIKMHTKQGDLYEFLTKKLGDFAAGGEAMASSWQGVQSNLTDTFDQIKVNATSILFEGMKGDMKDTGQYLNDNMQQVSTSWAKFFYIMYGAGRLAFNGISSIGSLLMDSLSMMASGISYGYNIAWASIADGFNKYFVENIIAGVSAVNSILPSSAQISLDTLNKVHSAVLTSSIKSKDAAIMAKSSILDSVKSYQTTATEMGKVTDNVLKGYFSIDLAAKNVAKTQQDALIAAEKANKDAKTDAEKKKAAAALEKAQKAILSQQKADAKELLDFNNALNEEGIKIANETHAKEQKAITDKLDSEKSMYASMLSLSGDWYTSESIKIGEQYNEWEKAGLDRIQLEKWLTASISSIDKKRSDEQTALTKKTYEEQNVFWIDLMGNINKAMDDQFFNAMTGKFTSFGNWLKDMWSSLTQSLARGLSKSLADSILGTGASGGGIQNIFTSYGGLSGVMGSLFSSSILSPSDMQSLGASTDNAGFTTTSGNTVFDAGGQVTKKGTDYTTVLSALSTAKSAYGMAGSAYSSVTGMFSGTGASTGSLIGEGWGGLNGAGASASSSAAGMSGGTIAGGASLFFHYLSSYLWGSGGPLDQGYASQYHDNLKYGAGSLNWSQLGTAQGSNSGYGWMTDTSAWANNLKFMSDPRNQFNNGIGGFMGYQLAMLNPIGGISGHVDPITAGLLGGLFGKSSYAGSGINIANGATSKSVSGSNYDIIHESGGWFSGSRDNYIYSPFTEDQKASIQGTIKSYEYLLGQIGVVKGIVASGGNFSTFQDFIDTSLTKGFISAINSTNTTEIYDAWVTYAKSINQTITQAMSSSIGDYVGSTRSFKEWNLGSGSVEQLKFTADYLTKDLAALESQMGVSGITAENYLSKYDEAIKAAFTPETINTWKNLGDAIMSVTDANTKYSDSLKALTPIVVKPADMMQSRTGDATAITGQSDGTVIKSMLDTFNKLVRAIEVQNTIAQLAAGRR